MMSAPYLPYTLEIQICGRPVTFKVAARNPKEAASKCHEFYSDADIPEHLHKSVKVLRTTQEKWTPAGFGKD